MNEWQNLIQVNEEMEYLEECFSKDLDPELLNMTIEAYELLYKPRKEIMSKLIVKN